MPKAGRQKGNWEWELGNRERGSGAQEGMKPKRKKGNWEWELGNRERGSINGEWGVASGDMSARCLKSQFDDQDYETINN